MNSFMSLPLEIRDLILDFALRSCKSPPNGPTDPAASPRILGGPLYTSSLLFEKEDNLIPNCRALLLVNRQIRNETQDLIHRLYKTPTYHLDIMFVNETKYWMSWLSIPVPADILDELLVSFRIFGVQPGVLEDMRYNSFSNRNELRCHYSHGFTNFLWGMLTEGPGFQFSRKELRRSEESKRDRIIRTLKLNFKTPVDTSTLAPRDLSVYDWLKGRKQRLRGKQDFVHRMRPEWMAEFICTVIHLTIQMTEDGKLGQLIYENVAFIKVSVDDKEYRVFDLAKSLAALDPKTLRYHFMKVRLRGGIAVKMTPGRWKNHALAQRLARGLPV